MSRTARLKPGLVIPAVLILLASVALGVYLYRHLEAFDKSVNTGPSLRAMLNPWFAAQRFLDRHGIESHRSQDLHSILHRLKPDDTLVLFNDTAVFNTGNRERLEQWMQSGGHLIIAANYEWDEEEESSGDPFLDAYGVRMSWSAEDDEEEDDESEEDDLEEYEDESGYEEEDVDSPASDEAVDAATDESADDSAEENAAQSDSASAGNTPATKDAAGDDEVKPEQCTVFRLNKPYQISWDDRQPPLSVDFGYFYTLDDASGKATGHADNWPNGMLQYGVGKGMMTVMVDTDIWMNGAIGNYDHAFLLWYLVGGSPNVWLVMSNESDDLITLLWRNAKYWLLGLAAMLLIWGWRRWVRFGPLIPDPTPDRRQLREHLDAEARFNWQHQQMEPLLKAVRDDIWLRLSQQHGIHHHVPDQQNTGQQDTALNKLAEISQQDSEKVRVAMTCPVPTREQQWADLISLLQTIRNAI